MLVGVTETEVYQSDILFIVEEQVLWFQISMHNSKLMQVLYTADDLLEELACFLLIKLRLLDYIVEELSTADILHDEEQLLGGLYDFK